MNEKVNICVWPTGKIYNPVTGEYEPYYDDHPLDSFTKEHPYYYNPLHSHPEPLYSTQKPWNYTPLPLHPRPLPKREHSPKLESPNDKLGYNFQGKNR